MYLPYTWPGSQRRRPAPQRADGRTFARLRYTPGTSPDSRRAETSAGVRKLEPRRGAPAAPSPAPPRGKAANEMEPPAVFRVAASGARLRHPRPAPVGDLNPDNAVHHLDRDRDRLAGGTRALCRRLLEKSSLTSNAATSPHGCLGPSTSATNARAARARSARPASVTLSRTATLAITAPRPSPAAPPRETSRAVGGRRDMHAQLRRERQAGATGSARASSVARPWSRPPSVAVRGKPTVSPTARSAGRRPLCVRGHRNISTQGDTH